MPDVAFVSQSDNLCHLFNAEFLDAIAQLPERQPKELGSGCLVLAGLLQRIDDNLSLHVFDLFAQAACNGGSRAASI